MYMSGGAEKPDETTGDSRPSAPDGIPDKCGGLTGLGPKTRFGIELVAGFAAIAVLFGAGKLVVAAVDAEFNDPLRLLRPQLVERRQAPAFELPDRNGTVHRLSDHAGRPVLINFWSVDCPPCLRELPSLMRLDAIAREQEWFSVLTVTIDESWDQVSRLFSNDTSLTVLFDPERRVVRDGFGTEMYPETFVIDSSGMIRARFDGERNWSSPEVLAMLEDLR